MKLQPGTEVTPNVRLESLIATGAMGSVWLAEHLTLNTKVAVKFISDRLDPDDPEVLERFVREAAAAAQIKSSHVVQTFDQGVMRDGTPYIVMEYLEGEGLGERLARDKTLPLRETLRIVQQTAKVLQSAHKLGIIHRDIKPDNIFLVTHDDELHVKLFDFGIAKHRREVGRGSVVPAAGAQADAQPELGLTNDGVMIGTPEYMSPEQVMSASSVDHHADLWALAVVTYVCISGVLPFRGKDVGELCVNLLEAVFEPPSRHCVGLPREVDLWFEQCLARDPTKRFQSARAMAAALAAALPQVSQSREETTEIAIDVRASIPSLAAPEPQAGDRGVRGATFSGTEADAVRARRRSMTTIGGAVALAVLGVIVAVIVLKSGPTDAPAGERPAARSSEATAEPRDRVGAGSAPAPRATPAEPAQSAGQPAAEPGQPAAEPGEPNSRTAPPGATETQPSAGAHGPLKPPPKGLPRPWTAPRPKDPGF